MSGALRSRVSCLALSRTLADPRGRTFLDPQVEGRMLL
jgi:hypothetical protein